MDVRVMSEAFGGGTVGAFSPPDPWNPSGNSHLFGMRVRKKAGMEKEFRSGPSDLKSCCTTDDGL